MAPRSRGGDPLPPKCTGNSPRCRWLCECTPTAILFSASHRLARIHTRKSCALDVGRSRDQACASRGESSGKIGVNKYANKEKKDLLACEISGWTDSPSPHVSLHPTPPSLSRPRLSPLPSCCNSGSESGAAGLQVLQKALQLGKSYRRRRRRPQPTYCLEE